MKHKVSVILGKFHPAHQGHAFAIQTALSYSEKVYLLVYTMKREPIPGYLRYVGLKEHFKNEPNIIIKWIEKDIPQEPSEHPDFWNIWKNEMIEQVPEKIDCFFGSEDYVKTMSELFEDCNYVIVDKEREIVHTSGTQCRNNTLFNWDYIIPELKYLMTKKICFVGGESTGKSTLTKLMSKVFQTNYVEEFGREYCLVKSPSDFTTRDFIHIAEQQIALEEEASKKSNRFLFCDTDAIVTQCFHILYIGKRSATLDKIIADTDYDHYFLLKPTISFFQDGTREFEKHRIEQFILLKAELEKAERQYTIIEPIDGNIIETVKNIKKHIVNIFQL